MDSLASSIVSSPDAPVWLPSLVEVLAKGTALLLVVCVAALALRRTSAGLRHLVWSVGLAGVLVLPLATALPWRLDVLPASLAWEADGSRDLGAGPGGAPAGPGGALVSAAGSETAEPAAEPILLEAHAADVFEPGATRGDPGVAAGPGAAASSGAASASGAAAADASAGTLGSVGGVSLPAEAASGAESLAIEPGTAGREAGSGWGAALAAALLIWAAGAAVLLAYIAAGAVGVRRIARRAVILDSPDWTTPLYEAADRLELGDVPRLLRSGAVQLPFTYGLLRPVIVLPDSAEQWSDERRRAVLFHELGHVRRLDLLSHLVGRLACALYWFHPLVWLAAKRARAECERACDDLVLNAGTRASTYADHLLQIVCGAARTSAPAVAIPMAQRKEFEGRMLAILEPGVRRDAPSRRQAAAVAAGLTALALSVATLAPARSAAAPPEAAAAQGARLADDGAAAPAESSESTADVAVRPAGTGDPSGDAAAAPAERQDLEAPDAGAAAGEGARGRTPDALPTAIASEAVASGAPADTDRVRHPRRSDRDVAEVASELSGDLAEVSISMARPIIASVLGSMTFVDAYGSRPMITAMPMPTPAPAPLVRGRRSRTRGTAPEPAHGRRRKAAPGDSAAVRALIGALRDSVPDVRSSAVYALGEIGDPAAVAPLAAMLQKDPVADVRRMAAWALGEIGDEAAVPALSAAVRSDDAELAAMAVWALGEIGDPAAVPALMAALKNADATVRRQAAWALGESGDPRAAAALGAALADEDATVRKMAAWATGELGLERAPAPLIGALGDRDDDVRSTAAWALGQIADPASGGALAKALEDPSPDVRRSALWALGEIGGETARAALLRAIRSDDPEIRRMAAHALARSH